MVVSEPDSRVRFEELLAGLSANFISLPPDRVDAGIEEAHRRICESLGFDHSSLWQSDEEVPGDLILTSLHRPPGGPPVPDRMEGRVYFPWCLQQYLERKVLRISSMSDLPLEAARDLETFQLYGIKSTLGLPLSAGNGPVVGLLSFDSMQTERIWPDALVQRLRLVAEILANALLRKRAEAAALERKARLSLAADAAGAGFWALDLATGHFWVTEKTRELFAFPPDLEVTVGRLLQAVHPEDRERVKWVLEKGPLDGKGSGTDYRIVHADGEVRWISSRGRLGPNGCRLMGISLDVTERRQTLTELEQALAEVRRLKDRLQEENLYLRKEIGDVHDKGEIIGNSDAMRSVLRLAGQVAPTTAAVLIQGETGTGKELIAKAIHRLSPRGDRLMVVINCAALPPALIESELFGREKGAFTGALTRQAGRFEIADGSTLFLDEIGDLPIELQAKLLRVLQEGSFERLGSTKTLTTNVRIIAATNRDLEELVRRGTFREDLYYRLNVFPIRVPPLRERIADVPPLVEFFIEEFAGIYRRTVQRVPPSVMKRLQEYPWPGNVRELRNVIERALIISSGKTLEVDLPSGPGSPGSFSTLVQSESAHIRNALKRSGGRVKGPGGAAALLGINPSTLYTRMKKFGISGRDLT